MLERMRDLAAYLFILATAVGGLCKLSPAVILAGASALALISILNHERAMARLNVGGGVAQATLMLSTAINATVIAALAYGLGHAARLMWGL